MSEGKKTTLTPEQAEQIKSAQLANILRKVRSGKTLTAAEVKYLDDASEEPVPKEELVTTTRLAELFQINRKTIAQWRKEERPGIPEKVGNKENVAAWRSWFASNPEAGHSSGKPRRDRETLLCEKLEIEIDLKKIEREQELGHLVEIGAVEESMTRITSAARGELLKLVADMPPMLAGLGESAIQKVMKDAVDTILENLSNNMHEAYLDAKNPENN